jgi:hypothetical protein
VVPHLGSIAVEAENAGLKALAPLYPVTTHLFVLSKKSNRRRIRLYFCPIRLPFTIHRLAGQANGVRGAVDFSEPSAIGLARLYA